MFIESVRITAQGREQLSRLKRHTGIEGFNVLCRWAFCVSLAEPTRPPTTKFGGDGGVEMTWRTFAGTLSEVYIALLKQRCKEDEVEITPDQLAEQLRLHIHRGLGYLAGNKKLRSIHDLVSLVDDYRAGNQQS
jgi:DNA sulfur modification protein DndE